MCWCSCELSLSVGFLCASQLRLHQRCKFVCQWLAKNHDSERTGAALLSVWTHHYLTHPGRPGDWWVGHDSCPVLLHSSPLPFFFVNFFYFIFIFYFASFPPSSPQWLPNKMTQPGLRNTSEVVWVWGPQKCNFPLEVFINMHRWIEYEMGVK